MKIELNEVDHIYTVDDVIWPGVTDIFDRVGIIDTRFFTPESAQRGTDIHKLTDMIDEKSVTIEQLEKHQYYNYALSYVLALDKYGIEILQVEEKVACPIYRYAGKLDKECIIDDNLAIIDIKTGVKIRWHKLQVIAYGLTYKKMPDLYCLYPKKTGKCGILEKVKPEEIEYLRNTFYSILNVYRWLEN